MSAELSFFLFFFLFHRQKVFCRGFRGPDPITRRHKLRFVYVHLNAAHEVEWNPSFHRRAPSYGGSSRDSRTTIIIPYSSAAAARSGGRADINFAKSFAGERTFVRENILIGKRAGRETCDSTDSPRSETQKGKAERRRGKSGRIYKNRISRESRRGRVLFALCHLLECRRLNSKIDTRTHCIEEAYFISINR